MTRLSSDAKFQRFAESSVPSQGRNSSRWVSGANSAKELAGKAQICRGQLTYYDTMKLWHSFRGMNSEYILLISGIKTLKSAKDELYNFTQFTEKATQYVTKVEGLGIATVLFKAQPRAVPASGNELHARPDQRAELPTLSSHPTRRLWYWKLSQVKYQNNFLI